MGLQRAHRGTLHSPRCLIDHHFLPDRDGGVGDHDKDDQEKDKLVAADMMMME